MSRYDEPGTRRKAVKCAICGDETYARISVCAKCVRDARAGREYRNRTEGEGRLSILITSDFDFQPTESEGALDTREAVGGFGRAMNALLVAIGAARTGNDTLSTYAYNQETPRLRVHRKRYMDSSPYYYEWVFPRNVEPELQGVVDAVQELVTSNYARGKSEGEAFLSRIARGEMSTEDLNKHEVRRAEDHRKDMLRAEGKRNPEEMP